MISRPTNGWIIINVPSTNTLLLNVQKLPNNLTIDVVINTEDKTIDEVITTVIQAILSLVN